ncbi:hypothetical protein H7200_02160 [Candidatus Saccharibacteria bacterium]|nr:hypothetical protein [Candidatus Saccharibacteria bacterium]
MKVPSRLIIFFIISAALLSFVAINDTSAAELTDEQANRISANCTSIKNSLNQLHASDALLRVNRGQVYESMGTKLMNNFNARLGGKSLDNKGLVAVTDSYQSALATFRTDYQIYERQLSVALRIDCTKEPRTFHAAVEDARIKRATVHDDVLRLHEYIDDYRSAVSGFILNFERVTGSN